MASRRFRASFSLLVEYIFLCVYTTWILKIFLISNVSFVRVMRYLIFFPNSTILKIYSRIIGGDFNDGLKKLELT